MSAPLPPPLVQVVAASAGRNHSAVVTATGESYSFGLNSYGQLGTGSVKKAKGAEDMALTPQLVRAGLAGQPPPTPTPTPTPLLLLLCGLLVVWSSCVLPKRLSFVVGSPLQWASCRCKRTKQDCWSACVLGHVHA